MTITLSHAALYAIDLQSLRDFYIRWFGATSNDGYHNPNTGLRTYFLTFSGGAQLEIMQKPGLTAATPDPHAEHLGYTHIAFTLGSRENVDTLTADLQQAGHTVLSAPRTTGDGHYESCILDPEGNRIELVA